MSISNFYKKTVVTQRLTTLGGSSKRQRYVQVIAALSCAIHPLSAEDAVIGGSAFYQSFKMFCASSADIEVGDRIVDGDDIYTVKGKSTYDDVGGSANEHIKLIIEKGR